MPKADLFIHPPLSHHLNTVSGGTDARGGSRPGGGARSFPSTPPMSRPVGAVHSAALRARRADVRCGRTSEARPPMPAQSGMGGSETPQILIWGMGGAAADLPRATAARRARTKPRHCPGGPYSTT